MLKGFKDFLMRGNIVELAVAVVIGTAFVALVTTFTEGIIDPLLAALGGSGENVKGLGIQLVEGNEKAFLDFGSVINGAIAFVLTAAVVYFLVVVPFNKIQERRGVVAEEEETEAELLAEIRDLLKTQAAR